MEMSKIKKQKWYENVPIIEMRELVNNYVKHTLVPSEQKEAIFNKISNPKPEKKKSAKALSLLFLLNFPIKSKSFVNPIYWLTIGSMLIFMNLPIDNSKKENQSYSIISSNEITEIKPEIPNSNSFHYEPFAQEAIENLFQEPIADISTKSIEIENSNYFQTKINNFTYSINPNSIANFNINTKEEIADLNMNFEMKYNTFFNIGNVNLDAPNEAILKNYSFGLWYSISNNLKIGAEFRQESFTKLESNSYNSSTSSMAFNMNCWEMALKFKSNAEIFNTNPIMQLNLGGGKHGFISRFSAGLMIPITDELNLITTGELSSLIYSLNSQIHSTEKIGFNIGFNLHLK